MSLDTFDNLKAEVADWLNRQDLVNVIPTFIRLLEAQVERTLRVREMVVRATASLTEEFTVLPQDFLSLEHAILNAQKPVTLEWVPMSQIDILQSEVSPGVPKHFTIIGDELEVSPLPDQEYEIEVVYYQSIPKLTTTNQVNWLLTRHPDVYLYGTLMQAAPYLKNDERVGLWSAALTSILDDIRVADERATKGGAPLKMRIKPY
jgi:hypothetical protein